MFGGKRTWSSKRRPLGHREQEFWGKSRPVLLQGCQPLFGAIFGESSRGFLKGVQAIEVALPWLTKPILDCHGGGLTHHGGSPGVSKASDDRVMDFESSGRARRRRVSPESRASEVACAEG